MTEEQVKKIARAVAAQMMELDGYPMFVSNMERYRQELSAQPTPAWADKELAEARRMGVTDGSRPLDLASRCEVAAMIVRAAGEK